MVGLEELQTEYDVLEVQLAESSGEDSLVTYRQMVDMGVTFLDRVYELANMLDQQEKEGLDTAEVREYITGILDRIPQALGEAADELGSQLKDARAKSQTASPTELALIEEDVAKLEERLDDLFEISARHIKVLEMLDLEDAALRKRLIDALTNRGNLTAGRLRLSIEERDKFEEQAGQYPDEASFRQRADASGVAVGSGVSSLERTIGVMDDLGMDVTEYRTLLVEATGELARGLTDSKVAVNLVRQWAENGREWLANRGPNLLIKLLIFFAILMRFLSWDTS